MHTEVSLADWKNGVQPPEIYKAWKTKWLSSGWLVFAKDTMYFQGKLQELGAEALLTC